MDQSSSRPEPAQEPPRRARRTDRTTRRAALTGGVAGGLVAAAATPALVALFPDRSATVAPARRPGDAAGPGRAVTEFGARGDGSTDDVQAIRDAVEAVAAVHPGEGGGGIVRFPAGIYNVGSPLVLPKNILLVGDGPIASRLVYTGGDADAFLTFGRSGQIATYSGVQGLWVDGRGRAKVGVRFFGPQEGSTLAESIATGATEVVVDVVSSGIEGGSNKFTVDRCWCWTQGDDGTAGIRIGAGGGPLTVRDTTFVGTGRSADPPALSAGVVAVQSTVTLDNVNVEHFESHTYLDRTDADVRDATGFFNTYGVRTSRASTGQTLLVSNAGFDRAEQCILDEGSGVVLRVARSYWNEAYTHDRRQFRRNFWEIGSANVHQSDRQQATMGWTSPGTSDTSRFKLTAMQDGRHWVESANIAGDGTFGAADSDWDGPHLRIGAFHLWIDTRGRLRMKNGAPEFETDGSVVGG